DVASTASKHDAEALSSPFPRLGVRFEMLEETLQIAHQMFEAPLGSQGRHDGNHYQATRLLNSPQSISRPRVPIMIGGGGEQKTLRLVAQYGDACNVGWGNPESGVHKLAVLRRACEEAGWAYDDIERTTLVGGISLAKGSERTASAQQLIDQFG